MPFALNDILSRARAVVMPPVCAHCRAPVAADPALCSLCWEQLSFIGAPICDRLGVPLRFADHPLGLSAQAQLDPPAFDRARAALIYGGLAQDLIHRFKYADGLDLTPIFAQWLVRAGDTLWADAPDPPVLVPVPLHAWRLRARRYNQAAILAKAVARRRGLTCALSALQRRKRTPTQVGLTFHERQLNVRGAFVVPRHRARAVAGRRVVLIDDVITSGATISACARTLKAAGATGVDVLALARVVDDDVAEDVGDRAAFLASTVAPTGRVPRGPGSTQVPGRAEM